MLRERAREVALLVALTDVLLLAVAFFASCALRFQVIAPLLSEDAALLIQPYIWILYVSIPLLLYLFRQNGLYGSLRRRTHLEVLWGTLKTFLLGAALLGMAIFLVQAKSYSRSIFFGYFLLGFVLVATQKAVIKVLASRARRRGYNTRNVLIVGAGDDSIAIARLLAETPEYGYRLLGHLVGLDDEIGNTEPNPILEHVQNIDGFLDRETVDEVIFAVPYADIPRYDRAIRLCEEVGITIHLKIDTIGTLLSRTYSSELGRFPMLTLSSTPHDAVHILAKRALDIVISVVGLIMTAPLMLATWAAVRLTSKGPAIFKQLRSGKNGRRFVLYKFRSMYVDAEAGQEKLRRLNEMDGPVFKMAKDPRVTPVGQFIRKWSIDELPQLFNVLCGDMSLVGPRPPIPDEVSNYKRWQKRRLSMRPGVTCLWQVKGRNRIDFDEWMHLDMQYIDNWSLGLDFKILAKTIPAVLFARGAR